MLLVLLDYIFGEIVFDGLVEEATDEKFAEIYGDVAQKSALLEVAAK